MSRTHIKPFPAQQGVPGFLLAGIPSGIKKGGVKDLGIILCKRPATAAGVFTKNRVAAAPVAVCRRRLRNGMVGAVLVNSGNANACTGESGRRAAENTCAAVGRAAGIREGLILPCSTGVIGVPLPENRIAAAVPRLVRAASESGIDDFADAIRTTDTFSKTAAVQATVSSDTVRVCGIAKGAGMIMPNMATMLAFILTDAFVEKSLLRHMLREHVATTFNRISVDGDMSTNDTVLLLASGVRAEVKSVRSRTGRALEALLQTTMDRLAEMIVGDGEGATKLIIIQIEHAATDTDAQKAARGIADSLLVKTAFYGEDCNWGRIMAALGSSGARFDPARVHIVLNGLPAVVNGCGSRKNLRKLREAVKKDRITLRIDLQSGSAACTYKTCDIGHEYVRINAEYTT